VVPTNEQAGAFVNAFVGCRNVLVAVLSCMGPLSCI
jgi:hypothetical protein